MACTGLRGGRGEMALGGHNHGRWVGLEGDAVPPWLGVSRFYHDSLSCWFFNFASCLSITANLSQTNSQSISRKQNIIKSMADI